MLYLGFGDSEGLHVVFFKGRVRHCTFVVWHRTFPDNRGHVVSRGFSIILRFKSAVTFGTPRIDYFCSMFLPRSLKIRYSLTSCLKKRLLPSYLKRPYPNTFCRIQNVNVGNDFIAFQKIWNICYRIMLAVRLFQFLRSVFSKSK